MNKYLYVDAWHQPAFRTEKEIDDLLSFCTAQGITDLFLHIRKRADAYYDSAYEVKPTIGSSAIDPTFDPLDYILKNKGTLKVHAWITTLMFWDTRVAEPEYISTFNQDWFYEEINHKFFDPSNKDVVTYLTDVCKDICKYPIDGLHLGRIRYHHETNDYSNINNLLSAIRSEVKVPLSASVMWNQNWGQDWQNWLANGLVDFVCPAIYMPKIDQVLKKLPIESVYPVVGYHMLTNEEAVNQVKEIENAGFQGYGIYSYDAVRGL